MQPVQNPLQLPDSVSTTAQSKPKSKIDIPYNRWENRWRRYLKSFIKYGLIIGIILAIVAFASIDDVSLNLVLSGLSGAVSLIGYVISILMGIVLQFGLLFWFLSRPKVEIIRPGDNTTVTFDDYWGQPELVKLVKQWMFLLRDRKEYEKMGGKYISGLLLYGPPGTGKTMLAKAIAGESGMAFISGQGTSFQGMFWGMDILMVLRFAKWARDLAKKYGACVAYIDEIDAIGMNRGGVRGGQPGMASGTGMGMGLGMMALSTLLSQMDGINMPSRWERWKTRIYNTFGQKYKPKPNNWHVMWMGSTNRPDVLDPALTRSGRLDTKIAVEAPDRASRRLIVNGYLSKIKHEDSIDIEAIVSDTNGLTPADISAAITKDAVRIAFFEGRRKVGQKDIDRAFMEQTIGQENPIEEMDEGQRRVLAYHEAGHAVAQYYVMPEQKIVRATIVRLSTGSQGHVMPTDTVDQHIEAVNRYAYDIMVSLAGRAAEKILTGEIFASTGGDYRSVQFNLWRLAVYGYFGPRMAMRYGSIGGESGISAMSADETLEKYWMRMEDATEKVLRTHWKEVTALAEELLVKKTLNGREVVDIIEGNQTADSLKHDIIPKTLAAIRAQALAESRGSNGYLNGGASNGNGVAKLPQKTSAPKPPTDEKPTPPEQEEIVIINSGNSNNGNGRYDPQVTDEEGNGRYTPQQIDPNN
jgi:cell division protease FtsH